MIPSAEDKYLASVMERDIDLLLLEEFSVSQDFANWFFSEIKQEAFESLEAFHSVTDTSGETDLLLRVNRGETKTAILIENKIAAPEQEKQAERYRLRGRRMLVDTDIDAFTTVMCAPQVYLDSVMHSAGYDHYVSYESIAAWFERGNSRRMAWRARVMEEAISQVRRGYTMLVNFEVTSFHLDYWRFLQRHFPNIQMRKPGNKGNHSNWIIMKGRNFSKGVKLHHKLDLEVLELGFEARTVADILARRADWPAGIQPVQKGKTASLQVSVPPIDRARPLEEQTEPLKQVLQQATRLLGYADLFDR